MTFRLILPAEQLDLVFTQAGADGILCCNGETCFSAGRLSGPYPFVVGQRPLKAAAQRWFLDRMLLLKAYRRDHAAPWPFMRKEDYDAPTIGSPEEGNGGGSARQVDAGDPEESRQGIHEGGQRRQAAQTQEQ